jgi:hypothetical protein
VGSIEKKLFLSKYSLDRNNTIASLFRAQYTSDILIAEYYGLRNTIFWGSKDLASAREQTLDTNDPTAQKHKGILFMPKKSGKIISAHAQIVVSDGITAPKYKGILIMPKQPAKIIYAHAY